MFKVLREARGRLFSAVASESFGTAYRKDVWAGAVPWLELRGYGLLVFSDFKGAIKFFNANVKEMGEIWKCDVFGNITLPDYLSLMALDDGTIVARTNTDWPDGTLMYKRVRITEMVYHSNYPLRHGLCLYCNALFGIDENLVLSNERFIFSNEQPIGNRQVDVYCPACGNKHFGGI
jgi:hypothetical protein